MVNLQKQYDSIPKAPPSPVKKGGSLASATRRNIRKTVVKICLDGGNDGFSAKEVLQAVPESGHKSANATGTLLGRGVRKSGFGLYRDSSGKFQRCFENAALAIKPLSDEEAADVVSELGFASLDDLVRAIDNLPRAVQA